MVVARFPLGVDIEQPRRIEPDLADRYFAADEVRRLRELPATEQELAFFRCWTRKEAYLKAIGTGIAIPLESFSVSFEPAAPAALLRCHHPTDDPRCWQLHHVEAAPGTPGAIAARRLGWSVRPMTSPY